MADEEAPQRDDAEVEPLDSEVAEAVSRPGHPAAYASNWRQILLVDASMGVAVLVAGLVVTLVWNVWIGAGIGALGAAYTFAVYRRYTQWRATRHAAGLPT